ncbi:hypothetical protein AAHC03_010070 [Spirometra sp. Aus1]
MDPRTQNPRKITPSTLSARVDVAGVHRPVRHHWHGTNAPLADVGHKLLLTSDTPCKDCLLCSCFTDENCGGLLQRQDL